jgi:hypothetical protein
MLLEVLWNDFHGFESSCSSSHVAYSKNHVSNHINYSRVDYWVQTSEVSLHNDSWTSCLKSPLYPEICWEIQSSGCSWELKSFQEDVIVYDIHLESMDRVQWASALAREDTDIWIRDLSTCDCIFLFRFDEKLSDTSPFENESYFQCGVPYQKRILASLSTRMRHGALTELQIS